VDLSHVGLPYLIAAIVSLLAILFTITRVWFKERDDLDNSRKKNDLLTRQKDETHEKRSRAEADGAVFLLRESIRRRS
jgi:hypothetical protein